MNNTHNLSITILFTDNLQLTEGNGGCTFVNQLCAGQVGSQRNDMSDMSSSSKRAGCFCSSSRLSLLLDAFCAPIGHQAPRTVDVYVCMYPEKRSVTAVWMCLCACMCIIYFSSHHSKVPLKFFSVCLYTMCVRQLNHCPIHHTHTVALSCVCSAPPLHQLDISWWCNHSLSVFEGTQWQMFQGTECSVGACPCVRACVFARVHTAGLPGTITSVLVHSLLYSSVSWGGFTLVLILVSTVIHQRKSEIKDFNELVFLHINNWQLKEKNHELLIKVDNIITDVLWDANCSPPNPSYPSKRLCFKP